MRIRPPWRCRVNPDPGHWYRLAFEQQRAISVSEATGIAMDWADWAAAEAHAGRPGAAAEVAEAYRGLVQQFRVELARRTAPEELRRHAGTMQGAAAEAGYWLIREGTPDEARAVVEHARAVLLSTRVQRLPPDLQERLQDTGRPELFVRYRQAERDLDRLERGRYDLSSTRSPQRQQVSDAVLTPEQRAWARFDTLRREVAHALGQSGGEIADRAVSWPAAAGRLVYLAAARRGGYALIVDGEGSTRWLDLPELTAAHVETAAADLRLRLDEPEPDRQAWLDLLRRLGTMAMGAVMADLRPGGDLTIVPLGGVGLLPLHAAILPGPEGARTRYALDLADIRYAPNATMTVEAMRQTARAVSARPRSVMAAGVDQAAGLGPEGSLDHAEAEAEQVCRLFGSSVPVRPATLDAVLGHLADANVWHFACHGIAQAVDPLDSALFLVDEPLHLRRLLAREPERHRLAVLSACQTTVPDQGRLDEVIGFPGALMRAGVAGVVASQWNVGDVVARYLTRYFYEAWLGGAEPHAALAAAQRWLRDASVADLADYRRRPPVPVVSGNRSPETDPAGRGDEAPGDRRSRRPFADQPWAWAAFTYTGA